MTDGGLQYTAQTTTTTANVDVELKNEAGTDFKRPQFIFEPEIQQTDGLLCEFSIVIAIKGATATADIKITIKAVYFDGTIETLANQITYIDPGTSYVNKLISGYHLMKQPGFSLRFYIQANETNGGSAKLVNTSYVRRVR